MLLLQIATDVISSGFDWGYVASGGLASSLTLVVQKLLSYKKDKLNVSQIQGEVYRQVMEDMEAVVAKYQKLACFRDPCKRRINGENESE